jgi:hypothetical protein
MELENKRFKIKIFESHSQSLNQSQPAEDEEGDDFYVLFIKIILYLNLIIIDYRNHFECRLF